MYTTCYIRKLSDVYREVLVIYLNTVTKRSILWSKMIPKILILNVQIKFIVGTVTLEVDTVVCPSYGDTNLPIMYE